MIHVANTTKNYFFLKYSNNLMRDVITPNKNAKRVNKLLKNLKLKRNCTTSKYLVVIFNKRKILIRLYNFKAIFKVFGEFFY